MQCTDSDKRFWPKTLVGMFAQRRAFFWIFGSEHMSVWFLSLSPPPPFPRRHEVIRLFLVHMPPQSSVCCRSGLTTHAFLVHLLMSDHWKRVWFFNNTQDSENKQTHAESISIQLRECYIKHACSITLRQTPSRMCQAWAEAGQMHTLWEQGGLTEPPVMQYRFRTLWLH